MQVETDTMLEQKRVAVLMTDGVEQVEYTGPRSFLEEHGAQVVLVAPKPPGENIQGFNHMTPGDRFKVEMNVREAHAEDFDALLLPGGVANPDRLRLSPDSIDLIREFARADKPIAAICHGPWTLIDAGVAQGKRITSWPSLQTDLRNAGALWSDEPVVVDERLVTSRKPEDIPAFDEAFLALLMDAIGDVHQPGHVVPGDAQTSPSAQSCDALLSPQFRTEQKGVQQETSSGVSEKLHNVQEEPGCQSTG